MNKIEEIKNKGGILWFIERKDNNKWLSNITQSKICNCYQCNPFGGGITKYDEEYTLDPFEAMGFLDKDTAIEFIIIFFLGLDNFEITEHLFDS